MFSNIGNASSGSVQFGFGLDLVGDYILFCAADWRELGGGTRK